MQTKSLRILFVTNNYRPYAGGVVSAINALAQELIAQGHEVFIVTLGFLPHHSADEPYVIRIWCPIRFRYKNNHMAIPWRMYYHVETIINDLKPDIIHSHHPWLLGAAARSAAKKSGIPIVFTYHTLYEHYAHYIPLPMRITKQVIAMLVRRYCASVDGIIAPSSYVEQHLLAGDIVTTRTILPSPIAKNFFVPAQRIQQKEQCVMRLLLVSRLVEEKNIHVLLDLIAQLHAQSPFAYSLTIVGFGAYAQVLQEYAYATLQLPKTVVTFAEKKEKEALINVYEEADLFIFSSVSDTQGLVLAEAMSRGLPVIALDGPGQRDIVISGVNGFLVHSLQDMEQCVVAIAHDHSLYLKLQQGALQTAQNYAPKDIVARLLRFYANFVG